MFFLRHANFKCNENSFPDHHFFGASLGGDDVKAKYSCIKVVQS